MKIWRDTNNSKNLINITTCDMVNDLIEDVKKGKSGGCYTRRRRRIKRIPFRIRSIINDRVIIKNKEYIVYNFYLKSEEEFDKVQKEFNLEII